MLPCSLVDALAFELRGTLSSTTAPTAGDAGLRAVLGESLAGVAAFIVVRIAPLVVLLPRPFYP
jgi:enterochelin esterase-like enzyme